MKKYLLFLLVVAFIGERQVYPQESSATKTLTFKNYSISYPADLRLAKKTESGNFMLLVTPKEDISMVIIDLSQYPYDVPLKDYAESAIEQLKEEHFCKFQFNYIPPFQLNNISLDKDKKILVVCC
jgi:hypothetical protein